MPAIVRKTMGKNLSGDILTDILNSSNEYYIGIGKCDTYNDADTVVTPIDSPREEREFRNNLQSIKKVEGATYVAKRVNWASGTIYAGWDDSESGKPVNGTEPTPWYIMNDAKEVYVCIDHGKNTDGTPKTSVVEPNYGNVNGGVYTTPFSTSDGYVWKFLYSITPERIYQFLSGNHIPVQEAESSLAGGDAIEDLQFNVRAGAVGGQITRMVVSAGGSGYVDGTTTVTIIGDGTGAEATASVVAGVVTQIQMTNYGQNYTYASVEIGGVGTDCVVRPVITSSYGLGYNPIDDLKSSSILMNIKPNGTENGSFIVENTFRQIGVLKNPNDTQGALYTAVSNKVLPSMTLQITSPFENGRTIVGSVTGAQAIVNDNDGTTVFYNQNESTGFKQFQVGEVVVQSGVPTSAEISSISLKNGIDRFSGDVLYIENRTKIRRDAEQQEDIKVVITV